MRYDHLTLRGYLASFLVPVVLVVCTWIAYDYTLPEIQSVIVVPPDEERIEVILPYRRPLAPLGTYEVIISLRFRVPFFPGLYSIVVDDCLDELTVNGVVVPSHTFHTCDVFSGRQVPLLDYLRDGENEIRMKVRNMGWDMAVAMATSPFDALSILAFYITVVTAGWCLYPYLHMRSNRSLARLWHRMPLGLQTFLSIVGSCLWWIGMVLIFWKLGMVVSARLAYERSGPSTVDTPLYWTVGRAITQGFQPYIDFFETKPPGIFILSAISFLFTKSPALTHVFQVIALVMIAVCVPLSIFVRQVRERKIEVWLIALSGAISALLMLYTAERSGEVQVESFGAAFGTFYLSLIAIRTPRTTWELLIASLLIMVSIGLKEPFFFSLLAGALLLCRTPSAFWHSFVLPCCVALLGGLLFLWWCGWFEGYIQVYLDEMLHRHITGGLPLWKRAFQWWIMWRDIWFFNRWLPWLLLGCFGVAVSFRVQIARTFGGKVLSFGMCIMSLYMALFALGIGGPSFNHHFAFTVPFFTAVLLVVIHGYNRRPPRLLPLLFLPALFIVLALSVETLPIREYKGATNWIKSETGRAESVAQMTDRLLDACAIDRYLYLGLNGWHPYAYTRHLPLGPNFFQYDYFFDGKRPLFDMTFKQNLHDALVIVLHSNQTGLHRSYVQNYLEQHFTSDLSAWECARRDGMANYMPVGYSLLIRK